MQTDHLDRELGDSSAKADTFDAVEANCLCECVGDPKNSDVDEDALVDEHREDGEVFSVDEEVKIIGVLRLARHRFVSQATLEPKHVDFVTSGFEDYVADLLGCHLFVALTQADSAKATWVQMTPNNAKGGFVACGLYQLFFCTQRELVGILANQSRKYDGAEVLSGLVGGQVWNRAALPWPVFEKRFGVDVLCFDAFEGFSAGQLPG